MTNQEILSSLNQIKTYVSKQDLVALDYIINVFTAFKEKSIENPLEFINSAEKAK